MLFTNQKEQQFINRDILIANINILRTECTTFLGMYIDEKLKWDEHIHIMKNKISKAFFAINKAKHIMPKKHRYLYRYSNLLTCIGTNYRANTAPILKKLALLK